MARRCRSKFIGQKLSAITGGTNGHLCAPKKYLVKSRIFIRALGTQAPIRWPHPPQGNTWISQSSSAIIGEPPLDHNPAPLVEGTLPRSNRSTPGNGATGNTVKTFQTIPMGAPCRGFNGQNKFWLRLRRKLLPEFLRFCAENKSEYCIHLLIVMYQKYNVENWPRL